MSGITRNSAIGASGLVGDWTLYRFTATDSSWTIPTWAAMLYIECIGGGGAGGGSWPANVVHDVAGTGGGGGGAYVDGMYSVSHMATAGITVLNVTVGATAPGVTGTIGGSGLQDANGTAGNTSSVVGTASTSGYGNMTLTAYGGGGGTQAISTSSGCGGGGGGTGSSGSTPAAGNNIGSAGKPYIPNIMTGGTQGIAGGGGHGANNTGGSDAASGEAGWYGGGGGGASNNSLGGDSMYGGGGGGGNGGWYTNTHGGAWNSWGQGTAGNGAANGGTFPSSAPANPGTSRTYGAGDGGAGLHDDEGDHAAEIGGAGGVPGGGGGGSTKNSVGAVPGGAGARGEVRIWAI